MRLSQYCVCLGFVWIGLFTAAGQSFSFSTPAGAAGQPGAADGTNTSARFNEPSGLAVDAAGTVYLADSGNHVIRRIIRSGNQWITRTIAGSPGQPGSSDGTSISARFYYPYGIALDTAGDLYVADSYNHTIRKLVAEGTNWVVSTLAGTAGVHGSTDGFGTGAAFYYPYGISVDPSGWAYVADSYNHVVRRVSPEGNVDTIAGTAGVSGFLNGTNSSAQFYYPSGIAVDQSGSIFLADTYNSLIRKITPLGTDWVVTTLAGLPRYPGGSDGTNRAAQFNFPFGISVAGSGTVYVADTVNDTIRTLTPVGPDWVTATIGGLASTPGATDGPAASARFYNPYGVAVDPSGNLVVTDSYNDTVRFGQFGFTLQVMALPGQIVLSWPLAASNYLLETSGPFNAGTSWSVVSGATVSGNQFVKTNTLNPGQAFFRLRLP